MNDFLKTIQNFDSIQKIYSNNLFTVKSISEYLGLWENLSNEEKYKIENLTTADSFINGNFDEYLNKLKKSKDEKLGYGEITKQGTENLISWIRKNIGLTNQDVFYDIGSGNGKIVLHLSLVSSIKKIVGIEIDELRYKYSLDILNQIEGVNNVEFINGDVLQCDISDATIVFMNDALFSQDLISSIFDKLKSGTHIISLEDNSFKPLSEFLLDVSWMPISIPFRHYIK